MFSTLLIVLPVFALIFAGWLARRIGVLGPHATSELNRFVVYLALPALLFDIVANAHWRDLWQPGFVAAFGIATAAVFGLTVALRLAGSLPLADSSVDGLTAAYSNTGYIGFPLVIAALGAGAAPLIATATIVTVCMLFAASIALIEIGQQRTARWPWLIMRVGRALIANPLVAAPIIAAIFPASGLALPAPIGTFLKLLGAAASPCALVALGLFLAARREAVGGHWGTVVLLVSFKLVLQPGLAWIIARPILDLSPPLTHAAVLIAALPTGTGPFMLAEFYRREADVAAKVVLTSTILSILTLTLYLASTG